MKWQVVGHKVLLRLKKVDEFLDDQLKDQELLKAMGFQIKMKSDEDLKRQQLGMDIGLVLAVGPMAWKNEALGYGTPGWEPWARVGDEVIITKYCGRLMELPDTKEEVYVINDVDIHLVKKASA